MSTNSNGANFDAEIKRAALATYLNDGKPRATIKKVRDPQTGKTTWTILSVNGGGERGIIPAVFLSQVEKRTGRPIRKLFDILAGTSTGGILIDGLSLPDCVGEPKYTAEQMVNLYVTEGPVIFKKSLVRQVWNQFIVGGAKYPASGIEGVLGKYFGNALYKDQLGLSIVASYETQQREAWFFKNWDPDDGARTVAYISRATSAAPTYFPPLANGNNGGAFIDGGVAANDPAACALAEAILLSQPGDDFLVVSVGTGKYQQPYTYKQLNGYRLWNWAGTILDILMDSQPQVTNYIMQKIMQLQMPQQYHDRIQRTRFYTFDCNLSAENEAMDNTDPQQLATLQQLGLSMTEGDNQASFEAMCDRLVALLEANEAIVADKDEAGEARRLARNAARRGDATE
jgi:patatin-like phospholipase/acyl hydrolase